MSSGDANDPLPFISRHAVDNNGRIGTLYDLNTDQVLDQRLPFDKETLRRAHSPLCRLYKLSSQNPPNLLQLINIDPAQRLSIASDIVSAKTMAALYHYSRPINPCTRLLHYSYISETEEAAGKDLHDLRRGKHPLDSPQGTHIIVGVNYGIEVAVMLLLPQDDQLITSIDQTLDRMRRYLKRNEQPMWSKAELEDFEEIRRIEIFSNISSLTSHTSLLQLFQHILKLTGQTGKHRPCAYDLCPINDPNIIPSHQLPLDDSKKLEELLLRLAHGFHEMDWYMNQSYPKCDEYLPLLKDDITRTWDSLKQMHDDEMRSLRRQIQDIRQGRITSTQSQSILDHPQAQQLIQDMDDFLVKLEKRRKKERFIAETLPKEFEYRHATDYKIAPDDDDQALQNKLIRRQNNRVVVCSTDQLYQQHPVEWAKLYAELQSQRKRNSSLIIKYVDFTDHPYQLHRFKVFPPIDNQHKVSTSQPPLDDPSRLEMERDDEIVNVLLLGESGVGKSTFINALVNYLRFNTYEEAEKKKPIILIPVSFLLTLGAQFDEYEVKYDGLDTGSSEDHDNPGQSVTQHCRSYIFTLDDDDEKKTKKRQVRLIDTPGYGDSRGVDQDEKNFEEILSFISHLRHLHAICILMKPNVTRMNVFFRSCMTHLFDFLGDHARNNILFCFTNARSTFYAPGNTGPLVREVLRILSIENVPFEKKNVFCLDSESFRFLVATHLGVPMDDLEVAREYKETWTRSSNEAKRLLRCILTMADVECVRNDSPSPNQIKLEINLLRRPILETMRNHLRNIILQESSFSSQSIELRPKHLTDYMGICCRCPREVRIYAGFSILPDQLHVLHSGCLTCACPRTDHIMLNYRLEYRVSKRSPQSIDDLERVVKDLIYASAIFTYFLMKGIYRAEEDQTLGDLNRMMKEDEESDTKTSSPLNAILVEKLEEAKGKYANVMRTMVDGEERADDVRYVQAWINDVSRLDPIKMQMDVIKKWKVLLFKNYEFQVPI